MSLPEIAVPTSAFPPVEVKLTPKTKPAAADTIIDTTILNPFHNEGQMR